MKTLTTKEEIKVLTAKSELKAEEVKIEKLPMHSLSSFLGKIIFVMVVFKICLFINQCLIHNNLKKRRVLINFLVGDQRGCILLNLKRCMLLSCIV